MLLAQDDSSLPAIIDNNLLKNWAESREPIRPEQFDCPELTVEGLTAEGERSESNRLTAWDDFRTLEWISLIQNPEQIAQQAQNLLAIA